MTGLNDKAVEQIVESVAQAPSHSAIGVGHFMHGQVCRVSQQSTPLIRPTGRLSYYFSSSWQDARMADTAMEWVNGSKASLQDLSDKGTYIGYLSSDNTEAVRASYAGNYKRLAEIKRRYDPENFFHHNRNIRPASS